VAVFQLTRVAMHYVELTHSYAELHLSCGKTVVIDAVCGAFVYL